MRILLTGASSFTGAWIADALACRGHHVIASFGQCSDAYSDRRGERVRWIAGRIEPYFDVPFGSPAFIDLVKSSKADVLALHGAEVRDYRSWDFDPLEATKRNTANVRPILEAFAVTGSSIVYTGSVFEPHEGAGDPAQRAFSPYGLSKHLTYEVLRMEAHRANVALAKFVIPNPFGPHEEPRFTNYLVQECHAGRTPVIGTPRYVRDNIHVDLLAGSYAWFVDQLGSAHTVFRPSGYVESQGSFAHRFLSEVGKRLGRNWRADESDQREFPEPLIRVNDMPAFQMVPDWSENQAWDRVAAYYQTVLKL